MAESKANEINVNEMIDGLVANAQKALHEFMSLDQEAIDRIVEAMTLAGLDKHMELAKFAVEETGRGVYEDKITKNMFATEYIYHSIKKEKTVGVIEENDLEDYEIIAEPIGVVCGVTPVTNPTSTTLFKSIICMKTRNPIIFGFHPSAQQCSVEAARIVYEAAVKAGAPEHCIQWIEYPSIDATNALMNHPGVATVLATGGSGMVKAAYSTGKPALGVGPGNVPCYIHESADLEQAVNDLILSKTFDNGMICASEQAAIVDKKIASKFEKLMKHFGCYFLKEDEIKKVSDYVINSEKGAVNPVVVGKSAEWIAEQAGVKVPEGTKILLGKIDGVGPEYPLSREKLSPVLAYLVAENEDEGIDLAEQMVMFNGMGHSAVIHAKDRAVIDKFADIMKASRLIVNSPSSHGAIGDIYNTNMPSLTLGCGSYGGNSVSGNVTSINLINQKRVAKRRVNMQWFKVPDRIYFEKDSIQYLEKMPNISKAVIVTDPGMVALGYVDKILYYLRKREDPVHCRIYSDVEPDPSIETVMEGAKLMEEFKPDVIIALGGGSAMDAAKGMWLFYEHPDVNFNALRLRFLDIRKRAFKFPKMTKTQLVAIPTTSGTGSEVTSFAVISDKKNNMKYPLADYELTPNVAIIDPQFVMSLPKSATADTGLDVLTHAIEAYVSVMASDYTDGLAIKAIQLVFKYLPRAYKNGANDAEAREKMHNASCIAGMAFTNAFLGLNHSIAHKIGGEYHVPHGRANAVLLPYVIEYNAAIPSKFVSFPKYKKFIADEKYAEIAHALGLPAKDAKEGVKSLVKAVKELMAEVNEPKSFAECGIDETEYMGKLADIANKAFEDQCTTANPKLPLVKEIEEIMKKAYYGEE
ncbi:MAG TPA: bifunctional acetaldehyde-CoA/alcohol dehydrogenase [Candidatus Ornithomonoglobus intestinigallinarum]|uniref:Aldehyde-alcohol dehydrogenase n=1 Tax=Candidatus Ornithomonoglobus intestinigallinarum TaxID=2840894 RepID=A0A9D1H3Z5_9FIRM|nr:bifunctional acetaldehyde-CoA/alcohol dehydrogenase [Candidatus Ornithomonoglobus intestinigallinarum]